MIPLVTVLETANSYDVGGGWDGDFRDLSPIDRDRPRHFRKFNPRRLEHVVRALRPDDQRFRRS
jgi:hypothetical protein